MNRRRFSSAALLLSFSDGAIQIMALRESISNGFTGNPKSQCDEFREMIAPKGD